MRVGIALPAWQHSLIKFLPSLMVFLRVKLVWLYDVELAVALGLLYKWSFCGGEAGLGGDRGRRPIHTAPESMLPHINTTCKWCLLKGLICPFRVVRSKMDV